MQEHQNGNGQACHVEIQIKKRKCGQAKKEDFQKQTEESFSRNDSFSRTAGIAFYSKYTPKRGKKTGRLMARKILH
jgi:hypothetical protein